ncbi:MAG: hypothetical protein ACLSVD_06795 [Eggerthellaceae bacterium]
MDWIGLNADVEHPNQALHAGSRLPSRLLPSTMGGNRASTAATARGRRARRPPTTRCRRTAPSASWSTTGHRLGVRQRVG